MPTLWTPPPGFFPQALSWFHLHNIARYQPVFRKDLNASYIDSLKYIYDFVPPCDGTAIGKPVHVWKGDPITHEDFGVIDSCVNGDYHVDGFTIPSVSGLLCTIGTGVPATIQDFWTGAYSDPGTKHPMAIRYGWLFSDLDVSWWEHEGAAMHWLGPA